ncbi:MAG: NfeD family protein [Clostridia bacterium]|nr:NfeD family protein [Clostridia bacterium]
MAEYSVWIWLALLIVLIITEIATVQLTTVWFALGAFVSLILAAFGVDSIIIQVIVFVAVSLISLIATRPLVKKYVNAKTQPTNADRCIGQTAVVTEEINNLLSTGAVKVNGTQWTARSEKGNIIPENETVTVIKIDGVKLIVD